MNYFDKAKEKINGSKEPTENKAKAVFSSVQNALLEFCRQEDEFAQAIAQSDKTVTDCCKAIMKNVGSSVSDIDVYGKAVEFFFPGAKIEFQMKIDLIGDAGKSTTKVLKMSFTDLL